MGAQALEREGRQPSPPDSTKRSTLRIVVDTLDTNQPAQHPRYSRGTETHYLPDRLYGITRLDQLTLETQTVKKLDVYGKPTIGVRIQPVPIEVYTKSGLVFTGIPRQIYKDGEGQILGYKVERISVKDEKKEDRIPELIYLAGGTAVRLQRDTRIKFPR